MTWKPATLQARSVDPSGCRSDRWLEQPNVGIVVPTQTHWPLLKDLLNSSGAAGNLTTDAHIAALAMEHGYTVYSNDADFGRFPKVKWVNPLNQPAPG